MSVHRFLLLGLCSAIWPVEETLSMISVKGNLQSMGMHQNVRRLERSALAFLPVAGMDKLNENLETLNENLLSLKREVQGPYKEICRNVAKGIFVGAVVSTVYVSHVVTSSVGVANPQVFTICLGGAAAAYLLAPAMHKGTKTKAWATPQWRSAKWRSQEWGQAVYDAEVASDL